MTETIQTARAADANRSAAFLEINMPFPAFDEKSNLTFDDLPVGTHVKIVADMVDMYFFYGETGTVEKNTHKYLGVIVRFDEPRHFVDGYIQETFNFNPKNLEIIAAAEQTLAAELLTTQADESVEQSQPAEA